MDGICITSPNTKGEPLVFHDVHCEPSAAKLPSPKSKAVLFLSVALAFTSSMAIAGLIMSAWAIHKINGIASPITPTSVALVSSVAEANALGYPVLSNVFQGTGYWALRTNGMKYPRSDHCAVSYQGNIYVFGGQSHDPNNLTDAHVLNNFTMYNMYLDTVEDLPPMPEPRYRFGYGVVNDKLYVFGGFAEIENNFGTTPHPAGTMVYDFTTGKWDPYGTNSPQMNNPHADLWGAAVNGMVYALGGYNPPDFYNAVNTVEVLNPATGVWSYIANMTYARGDLQANVANGSVYAFGGVTNVGIGNCSDYNSCHPWTNTVEVYNANNNTWSLVAPMNWARGDFATVVLKNGHIIAVGGENGYDDAGTVRVNQVAQPWVEEYILEHNIWVPKAALSQPRFRFAMASDIGNFMYAFGGAPTCDDSFANDTCSSQVLSSIIGFYDNEYPSIWAALT